MQISEALGALVLSNVTQLLCLIQVPITCYVFLTTRGYLSKHTTQVMLASDDEEIIVLCLGLLKGLLSGAWLTFFASISSFCILIHWYNFPFFTTTTGQMRISREEEVLLFDVVPLLEGLTRHERPEIGEAAAELRVRLAAQDRSWAAAPTSTTTTDTSDTHETTIADVMRELSDPLLPVRAHGLVALRRLVLRRDPVALRNLDKIVGIFQAQLHDTDSFVYLGAVHGLSALGDLDPPRFVPLIASLYADATMHEATRLKLGEALMLVALRCGAALPKYGTHFFCQ